MCVCVHVFVFVVVTTTNDASHFTLYNYANINLDILAITVKQLRREGGAGWRVEESERVGVFVVSQWRVLYLYLVIVCVRALVCVCVRCVCGNW